MSTTITPVTDWRAITDTLAKRWHLGTAQSARVTCGTTLAEPGTDGFEAVADLTRIDCGSCKRMKPYKEAMAALGGAATAPAASTTTTPRRRNTRRGTSEHEGDGGRQAPEPSRRRTGGQTVTGTEAAEMLADAAAAAAAVNDRPSNGGGDPRVSKGRKGRQSAAARKNAQQAKDAERRAAVTENADAAVSAIDAALAEAGQPEVSGSLDIDAVRAAAEADQAAGECQADE